MPYNFPNEPSVLPRLASAINDSIDELDVDTWGYDPSSSPGDFAIRIDDEYMFVGTRVGTHLSDIVRAAEAPGDAVPHLAGSIVRVVLTEAAILDIASSVAAISLLFDSTLGASASSIDTGTLPTGYKALKVLFQSRTTQAAGITDCSMRFNGDSGANYHGEIVFARGVTEDGSGFTGANGIRFSTNGANAPASTPGQVEFTVHNHEGTTFFKTAIGNYGLKDGAATTTFWSAASMGWWLNTAAITQITMVPDSGQFAAGTRLTVYGLN